MPEHQPDNGEERTPLPEPEEEADERYVAFPGGIPKRWFNPAFYLFLTILIIYTVVAIVGEFQEGAKLKSSLVVIARHIWMHLADFCFTLVVTTVVICKGLERVMYYLDAKRQAARDRRRAERAERLTEEYKLLFEQEQQRAEQEQQRVEQLAEQARQRAEQERQRAEQEQQLAEQERQRAEQEQQLAEQERQRAEQEQQRAEQEQQRAEQAEAEKERLLQELQKYREDEA